MPAKDYFHDHVCEALIQEGWTITHDPFVVRVDKTNLPIDLGAERMIAAEKASEKIAVEVKSFRGPSRIHEFHGVLGQYLNYQLHLQAQEPDRQIYLALPDFVYQEMNEALFFQKALSHFQLQLIVFSPTEKRIEQWKK